MMYVMQEQEVLMTDILNNLFLCFQKQPSILSERTKTLDASFDCNGDNLIHLKESVFEVLRKFPARDQITIIIEAINRDPYCLDNIELKLDSLESLEKFMDGIEPDDDITVNISIKKKIVDNTLSIYNYKSFSNEILNKNTVEIMSTFSNLLYGLDYLVLELFDSDIFLSTDSMIFKSAGTTITKVNFKRLDKITACKKSSYFYNFSDYGLIPDDFNINSTYSENPFENLFLKIKTILSLAYISNTSFIEKNILKLQISGQRNLDFSYNLLDNNITMSNSELYNIYDWIYTDGNPVDKAIIARNIMSLHCKYMQIIDTDEKTFASIQSNYAMYQKSNVSQYLDLKNKLAKNIIELTSKTGEIILGLSDRLRNSVITFFTFIITVLLSKLASGNQGANFFNREITILSDLILLGSVIFVFFGITDVNYQIKKLKQGYDALKDNYKELLDEVDIQEIFKNDAVLNDNLKEVEQHKKRIMRIWIAFLIIVFIAIEILSTAPLIRWIIPHILSYLKGSH